jgi:hypothetical protein
VGKIDRYPTYKGGKVTEVVVYASHIGLRRFSLYVVNIGRWSPYEGGHLDRFHCILNLYKGKDSACFEAVQNTQTQCEHRVEFWNIKPGFTLDFKMLNTKMRTNYTTSCIIYSYHFITVQLSSLFTVSEFGIVRSSVSVDVNR